MANYAGRGSTPLQTLNFGGINAKATVLNIKENEAQDITNWDIDLSGAIARRAGYTVQYALSNHIPFFDKYVRPDGTEVYVAVAKTTLSFVSDNRFFEATSPAGPWTERTTSSSDTGWIALPRLYLETKPFVGTYFNGDYYLANGANPPILSTFGSTVDTLENKSLLTSPPDVTIANIGTPGTTRYLYYVTTVTGRGEAPSISQFATGTGNATLSSTNYNSLAWTPITGALSYNIYRYNSTRKQFEYIANTASNVYLDQGQLAINTTQVPPSNNTAYNTPNDWNVNGYPEGFAVLARNRDQRLMAWRGSTVWVSALNNGKDWFKTGDAFTFTLAGGEDSRIKAVTTLYDFTVFFSQTNAFFFTGTNSANFYLQKVQGTGCLSPRSFVQVGDDVYLWSQYGPTTLRRVLAGQDVQTDPMSFKISPIVHNQTNRSYWPWINVFHDIKNQKVVWTYPSTGSTTNDHCLVYDYAISGWTKYDTWDLSGVAVALDKTIYGAMSAGITKLFDGNTDNGTAIAATYKTAWVQDASWMNKRMVWLDQLMDPTVGDYSATTTIMGDWGRANTSSSHTLTQAGTTATTDGATIQTTGSLANLHRLFTNGDSHSFQMTFSVTSSSNAPRIIGWKPELRTKGLRS